MGHRQREEAGRQLRQRISLGFLKSGTALAAVLAIAAPAAAGSNIDSGSTYLASNLGNSVNPDFNGGTLELDSSTTISRDFKVGDVSTNTIDIFGSTVTMSGAFTGTGPLTFTDSKGGGVVTLTSSGNSYTGITTITGGASVALSGSGAIPDSSSIADNGTFDISATTSGTSVVSLGGSGTVNLGTEPLALTVAADTFSGTITGSGSLTIDAGTETLTGTNTYTGPTSIVGGTLALSGSGSISASGTVYDSGVFDISATSGASITSLSGTGQLLLGSQTLTLTNASGTFSGVVSGSGGLVLTGGTELLSGENTFTGPVVINGGDLQVGSTTVAYNVTDNGTFTFYSVGATTMSGVISGPGGLSEIGSGIATITTPQTYTGATTVSTGRLALSGNGSISSSQNVTINGTFDISETSGAAITSLLGSGIVNLGAASLTLTNASGSFSGSMSGSGGLVLQSGNEALSGTNTYAGATTIASGSLTLLPGGSLKSTVIDDASFDISSGSSTFAGTASIASLSGGGVVSLGNNTLILTDANDSFSGVISGTGGLAVMGGTETLTAANTYTGATTITSGSLILGAGGSLSPAGSISDGGVLDVSAASGGTISFVALSGSGSVVLGSHDLTLTGASGVFSGVIGGSGGVTIAGGRQTLAGANTYTGGTVIESGATLQLGSNGSAGSVAGDVTDNGTLAFDRSDTSVFSGVISGTGGVLQNGGGTTILAADNTYTGGTTISAGTLQIGNGGTSGSLIGNITDNGTIAFGRSDSSVFTAAISGTGGLTQATGTTILTANNSYTGATTIANGATLAVSGSGSIAGSSGVTVNGTFDISGAASPQITSLAGGGAVMEGAQSLTLTGASGVFSGVLSGNGGLTLVSGTQTLSGINTYTGATAIEGGALTVNGSIASSQAVTVGSGGTLTGTGTVPAVAVAGGGILAPGAGTLTATGPVTFATGSTYAITLSSGSAGKLATTGSASLAGTLTVTSTDGSYPLGQKLTVLSAEGGVSGSFTLTPLASSGAEFSSALSYDANNVYLEVDLAKLSPLLPAGASRNQANVVGAIDSAIAAGDTLPQTFENLGNLSSSALAGDASQLAGEIGSDIPEAGRSLFTPFVEAVFDRISDDRLNGASTGQTELWLSAFGGTGIVAGDPGLGSHKFKTNAAGFVGGGGLSLSPDLMLGAAVSVGAANFHLFGDTGRGRDNAVQASLYGFYRFSPHLYSSFAAAAALNEVTTHRALTVSGTDDVTGKVTAMLYGGRYETGVSFDWATPYIAFQDVLASVPGYTESASSGDFALRYAARTANTGTLELGVREGMDFSVTPNWVITPNWTMHLSGRLAWGHDFFSQGDATASFASLASSDFTVYHARPDSDAALVALGTEFRFDGGFRLNLRLDSAVTANSQSYTGMGGLGYTW